MTKNSRFHLFNQQVGAGIEDAFEADQIGADQWLSEEREDRRAVHHCGFEHELQAFFPG